MVFPHNGSAFPSREEEVALPPILRFPTQGGREAPSLNEVRRNAGDVEEREVMPGAGIEPARDFSQRFLSKRAQFLDRSESLVSLLETGCSGFGTSKLFGRIQSVS
jgi:hypothetical protein